MKEGIRAGRRGRLAPFLFTAAGSLILAYVLLVLVAIIYRHPRRFDFSEERENTLSKETLNRLGLLHEEVRVVFPYLFQVGNPLDDMRKQILARARLLLDEYMARQPRLRMEAQLNIALVDDSNAWESLREKYGLGQGQVNRFIFLSQDGKTRQAVTPDDLAVFDKVVDPREKGQVHEFRAEKAFTDAISRIIFREKRRIYCLADHREAGLGDKGPAGMEAFREELETSGFEVRPLSFRTEAKVPADCDILLIDSPESPFEPGDRRLVNDYLLSGGRLLAALGPAETGLEELLDQWGARAEKGRVYQRKQLGPRAVWSSDFLTGGFNRTHTITAPFSRENFAILIAGARTLEFRDTGGLHGEYLLKTSENAPTFVDRNKNDRRDDDEELGPKVLAGAVWRALPARPLPDYRHVDTRIVVLGESAPLQNQYFPQFSHRLFLMNCASWLIGREERVAGESTAWTERRIKSSPEVERFLFWVPIFLFPGVVVSLGGFIYFLRRS